MTGKADTVMTDKADTVRESPTNQEIAADLPAMTLADHPKEADHTIDAQEDTEAPHLTMSIPLPQHKIA